MWRVAGKALAAGFQPVEMAGRVDIFSQTRDADWLHGGKMVPIMQCAGALKSSAHIYKKHGCQQAIFGVYIKS